jgi:hypothetical protein
VHTLSILIIIFNIIYRMNPNDFTSPTVVPIKTHGKIRVKSRQPGPFLKGPVPMDWIYAAGGLPGQCLHVGIVLWHEVGIAGSRTVKFRPSKASRYGMHRDTSRRALKRLQKAGLINTHIRPGQCLEIEVLNIEKVSGTDTSTGYPVINGPGINPSADPVDVVRTAS